MSANAEEGTSGGAPPSYGTQPYQGQPPYYAQPSSPDVGAFLGKRVIFLLMAVGLAVLWVGTLVELFGDTADVRRIGVLLETLGGVFAALVAVAGALGSKRTTDHQNLGLLILAALLLLIAIP